MPLHLVEAVDSQSGKGTYVEAAILIYGDEPYMVANDSGRGGVGSLKESVSTALVGARNYVVFDNIRGKFKPSYLELLLTARKNTASGRPAYSAEVQVDPTMTNWFLTSNGLESNVDLANRSNIIKIRKKADGKYKYGAKELFHNHIEANQPYYLGCILSIVRRWLDEDRPQST